MGSEMCIRDRLFHDDDGRKYLVQQTWDHREYHHAFDGITVTEFDTDTMKLKPETARTIYAGTDVKLVEGPHLYKINGYYYLFASTGTCCEGLKSTYQTVVGRSSSLWGPYLDKQGRSMLDNNHVVLIHKNKSFVGTGHNAELITDKANNDWILYHGVSVSNPHGRVLLLDRVDWRKGWPVVKSSSASTESLKPNF